MFKRVLRNSFSLLNLDYVKLGAKWNYRNVISPYHRIYYIDDGYGELSDTEKMVPLEPGYLYMIPHYTLCDLACPEYLSQYFVQFFEESTEGEILFQVAPGILKVKANELDIKHIQRLIEINPGRGINRSNDPQVYEKNIFYEEYQRLNGTQNLSVYLETQGLLAVLFSRFIIPEIYNKTSSHQDIPDKILDAMRFIAVNLHQNLSVGLLADRANQNIEHFSRSFERHTGMRPSTYITEKRIEKAKHMIATTRVLYSEIAELAGFRSLSSFSRAFKKITKLSPRQYRMNVCGFASEMPINKKADNP
jgi:AraC family transcriptional regulator